MNQPTQEELNDEQWRDEANWSGWAYFSKRDSRLLVPKRVPAMGWTINLGHRKGPAVLLGIFLFPFLVMVIAIVIAVA